MNKVFPKKQADSINPNTTQSPTHQVKRCIPDFNVFFRYLQQSGFE